MEKQENCIIQGAEGDASLLESVTIEEEKKEGSEELPFSEEALMDEEEEPPIGEDHRKECAEAYDEGFNAGMRCIEEREEELYQGMEQLVYLLRFYVELLMCYVANLRMFCDPKARRRMNKELACDLAYLSGGDSPGYTRYVENWCDGKDPLDDRQFKSHLWRVAIGQPPTFRLSPYWVRPGDMCDQSFVVLLDQLLHLQNGEHYEEKDYEVHRIAECLKRSYGLMVLDRDHALEISRILAEDRYYGR